MSNKDTLTSEERALIDKHLARIEREAKEYAEGLMGLGNNYEYSIHWADMGLGYNSKNMRQTSH